MVKTGEYRGWVNRDTWELANIINSDEFIYDRVTESLEGFTGIRPACEKIKSIVTLYQGRLPITLRLDKVSFYEIAKSMVMRAEPNATSAYYR